MLSSDAVERTFRRLDYAKVIADWTRKDAAILEALRSFGRESVPLYLVYPADPARGPEMLPTAITPGIVIDALERGVAPSAPIAPAPPPGGTAK